MKRVRDEEVERKREVRRHRERKRGVAVSAGLVAEVERDLHPREELSAESAEVGLVGVERGGEGLVVPCEPASVELSQHVPELLLLLPGRLDHGRLRVEGQTVAQHRLDVEADGL